MLQWGRILPTDIGIKLCIGDWARMKLRSIPLNFSYFSRYSIILNILESSASDA